jgi:hypothetical protein
MYVRCRQIEASFYLHIHNLTEPIAKLVNSVAPVKTEVQNVLKRLDAGFRGHDVEGILQLALTVYVFVALPAWEHLKKNRPSRLASTPRFGTVYGNCRRKNMIIEWKHIGRY